MNTCTAGSDCGRVHGFLILGGVAGGPRHTRARKPYAAGGADMRAATGAGEPEPQGARATPPCPLPPQHPRAPPCGRTRNIATRPTGPTRGGQPHEPKGSRQGTTKNILLHRLARNLPTGLVKPNISPTSKKWAQQTAAPKVVDLGTHLGDVTYFGDPARAWDVVDTYRKMFSALMMHGSRP